MSANLSLFNPRSLPPALSGGLPLADEVEEHISLLQACFVHLKQVM